MPGGVDAGLAVFPVKKAAAVGEAQAKILRERANVSGRAGLLQRRSNGPVGGLAGHEPKGKGRPRALAHRAIFGEPKIQKRFPRGGLDEGFHHAPHAGGHSAGENTKRELAARHRGFTFGGEVRSLRRVPARRDQNFVRVGRPNLSRHAVALVASSLASRGFFLALSLQ